MAEFNEDDLFKKILENPPAMQPDLDALEDMNRRLDAVKDKRKGVLWWWLVPLLFIPLLFSSIFFYLKFQNAKQEIYDLNLQLTENQTNTKQETLTQKITINEFDTIFNTIYKDVYVERIQEIPAAKLEDTNTYFSKWVSSVPNKFPSFGKVAEAFNTFDKSSLQPSQLELLRSGKVISLRELYPVNPDYLINSGENDSSSNSIGSTGNFKQESWNALKNIETISFLKHKFRFEHPLPNSDHFLNLTRKRESNKINPLWYFVPTGFQAGLNWSPLGIAKLPGANNKVKTIGFNGEVEFTINTRLQFGLDYLSVPLKAESQEDLNQFPMATPNNPGDIFRELYGDFTYFQVPLTLKYVINSEKKWRPTLGFGMIARIPLKEQFRYEFVSINGGEYTNNQSLNDGAFSINNLRGTLGFEYQIYQNYILQVEGHYNYQLGQATNPYFNLRYGGLNMGLKYKF